MVVRFTLAIPASGKLKQEDCNEFQASLGPEGGGRRRRTVWLSRETMIINANFLLVFFCSFIVETGSDYVPLACLKLAM